MTLSRYRDRALRRVRGALVGVAPAPSPTPTPSVTYLNGDPTRLQSAAQTDRSAILTVIQGEEWAGFPSTLPVFATDVTCNDPASIGTKALAAFSNNANAYHRIRLQTGSNWANDWQSFVSGGVRPNFGSSGGLIIEPDTGHDPVVTGLTAVEGRRIEFRGICFARASGSGSAQFETANYSGGAASKNIIKLKTCRFGAYWHPTNSAVAQFANWSNAIAFYFAEQVIVEDCTFRRCIRPMQIYATRILVVRRCDVNETAQVMLITHELSGGTTGYKGQFADDDAYLWINQNTNRGPPDAVATIGGVHIDFVQHARMTVQQGVVPFVDPPPLGSGPYPPGNFRMVLENNIACTDVSGSDAGIIPAVNLYIDSDRNDDPASYNPNASQKTVVFNNISTGTGFLVQVGDTTNHVQCNSSISCPQMPASADQATYTPAFNTITAFGGGSINAQKNIVRSITSGSGSSTGSVLLGDQTGTSAGSRPQDKFAGTFALSNGKWCFTLTGGFNLSLADYNTALIGVFTPDAGVTAGAA